jgi:hypothetical protein
VKEILRNNQFRLLCIFLLLGNAFLLPITADEAYYFSWSDQLAWGYFDHPPLIAWLLHLTTGATLRVPFLLLCILFVLVAKEKTLQKFIFLSGVHLFLGGALPDTLMVVSGFLVLHSFKKWANTPQVVNAAILGVCVAVLGYSKFHGILLVIALALGYWNMRKQWTLYISIAVAAVLLIPYFLWQYNHQWVTFNYHFNGRFATPSITSLLEFLALAVLLWWPLVLFYRKLQLWAKVLILSALILFGWGAYNGSAELHWLLVFMWIIPSMKLPDSKRTRALAFVLFGVHTLTWVPQVREYLGLQEHFRAEIGKIDSDEQVIFLDAYQDAAIYELATGKESYALSHPGIRRSQYNLRPYPFDGEEVVVFNRMGMGQRYFEGPLFTVRETLYDLSDLKFEWEGWTLRFEPSDVPSGYNWILYSYRNGVEQSRERLCPGTQAPNVSYQAGVDQFLTLEKNWMPSGLWIPLP